MSASECVSQRDRVSEVSACMQPPTASLTTTVHIRTPARLETGKLAAFAQETQLAPMHRLVAPLTPQVEDALYTLPRDKLVRSGKQALEPHVDCAVALPLLQTTAATTTTTSTDKRYIVGTCRDERKGCVCVCVRCMRI